MAKNFKAIAEGFLGTTESILGHLLETRATRDKGMKSNCMYLSIRIYQWQGIAKAVGTRVSGKHQRVSSKSSDEVGDHME